MSTQGWWRKLTGSATRPPGRSEWPFICTNMAQLFERERQRFFSNSIKFIEEPGGE